MSSVIVLDGKEYISSRRASELSGYAQDYIGQLARGGHVEARRIGGLWYISSDSLKEHQEKKDGLLAAVQSDSLGIREGIELAKSRNTNPQQLPALATYHTDHKSDLIPKISEKTYKTNSDNLEKTPNPIQINIKRAPQLQPKKLATANKTFFYGTVFAGALTIILLVSLKFADLTAAPMYTINQRLRISLPASIGAWADSLFSRGIEYHRSR